MSPIGDSGGWPVRPAVPRVVPVHGGDQPSGERLSPYLSVPHRKDWALSPMGSSSTGCCGMYSGR